MLPQVSGVSSPALRAFAVRVVIALALAGFLTAAGIVGVNRGIDHRVQKIHRISLLVAPPPPAGANFLLIGSDTREFVSVEGAAEVFGDPAKETGRNSDTLMVAHVEPGSQRTLVVSFPRDLVVDTIRGLPGRNRINAAYGFGGPQAVIDMLKDNFDIDIHHYVEVDFESFQEVVDAIGHVFVYFPYATRDDKTGVNAIVPGCHPLDGPAALAYVRSRSPEYLVDGRWVLGDQDAPDLHRIARQQEFIRNLAALAISKSLSDPFLAIDIADRVLGYIKADQDLERSDVNALIRAFRTVEVKDPNAVRFETVPVKPDPANPRATLVLADGAQELIDRLRTFGDETPPVPSVSASEVRVQVLDGSGGGYAQDTLTRLMQFGFLSGGYGDAGRTARFSEIRYPPDQLAAARTLFPFVDDAVLVKDPSIGEGTVVLVIGKSFAGITYDPTATTLPAELVDTTPEPTATPTTRRRSSTTTPAPGEGCA